MWWLKRLSTCSLDINHVAQQKTTNNKSSVHRFAQHTVTKKNLVLQTEHGHHILWTHALQESRVQESSGIQEKMGHCFLFDWKVWTFGSCQTLQSSYLFWIPPPTIQWQRYNKRYQPVIVFVYYGHEHWFNEGSSITRWFDSFFGNLSESPRDAAQFPTKKDHKTQIIWLMLNCNYATIVNLYNLHLS